MNHTNSFKPPHDTDAPNPKELFGFITGVFYFVVMALSAPWALSVKKPGTIGTRAYWFDVLCSITVLCMLSHEPYWYPDTFLFRGMLFGVPVLYVYHLLATIGSSRHVHRQCIGRPHVSEAWELGLGVCVVLLFLAIGCVPFAIYIGSSVVALGLRQAMVRERDRQRNLQMEDALWEQNQMMNLYEHYKKGE